MKIRFGLDIGIASVGWAVVADNYEVLEAGSNIFEAADASQNQDRRTHRQMRRIHRRKSTRIKDFNKFWENTVGEVPKNACNNPLELRVRGLSQALTEEEIYFVLKNMLLHRGISYLEDAAEEETNSKSDYKRGLLENQQKLNEDKFPCEIQYDRMQKYGRYRGNITIVDDEGEKIILSNIEYYFCKA